MEQDTLWPCPNTWDIGCSETFQLGCWLDSLVLTHGMVFRPGILRNVPSGLESLVRSGYVNHTDEIIKVYGTVPANNRYGSL